VFCGQSKNIFQKRAFDLGENRFFISLILFIIGEMCMIFTRIVLVPLFIPQTSTFRLAELLFINNFKPVKPLKQQPEKYFFLKYVVVV